jgi:hypothetical protein
LREIEESKRNEDKNDAFNNFKNVSTELRPPLHPQTRPYYNQMQQQQMQQQQMQQQQQQQQQMQQQQQQQQQQTPPSPPNKFSAQYAQYIGQRSRAQASARIRLGGVF